MTLKPCPHGKRLRGWAFHAFMALAVSLLATLASPQEKSPTPVESAAQDAAKVEPPSDAKPRPTVAAATEMLMEGRYAEAKEAFEALVEASPSDQKTRVGGAAVLHAIGEYEKGIQILTQGVALSTVEEHVVLGDLLWSVGRYDEAIGQVRNGIDASANHAGARRRLGQWLEDLGRRDESIEVYRWFDRQIVERPELPRDAAWVTDAALGFLRFSVLTGTNVAQRTEHVLQKMLQTAYSRLDRAYWPARIAAAELLREKFNNDEEDGSVSDYQAALRINPNLPEAHVGIGEVALENWGFEEIEKRVESALQTNPHFAPAIHLLAKKLILERRYEQAVDACDRALRINLNDLTALSLRAAAAACRYDAKSVDEMRIRVEEINPRCARFHRTLGDALGGIRQYESSEKEYLKAIELDAADANARTELGMMYMQWGLEDKARDALDAAWALDPYNERTKFTLELLDSLRNFASHETEHFIVRHDASRDPGLGEYVASYLEPIYVSVTGDYDAGLDQKTIIEFFPTHRAFGVRITGKPWIHTVGACTGRVIALETPKDNRDVMGRFHLGRVLKHEFTHTVTLAITENRIPHWFTEGLAVYQEDSARSFDWCQLLAEAVRRDELFTLESIDWGFIRPKKATDRTMAYAQSEWMVEYIAERFGYDAIQSMLRRYKDGQTQTQVFSRQLGLEISQFDDDFRKWSRGHVERWGFPVSPPENLDALRTSAESDANPGLLGRLSETEWDEGEPNRAIETARKALDADPREPRALRVLIEALQEVGREQPNEADRRAFEDEALGFAERLLEVEPANWTALECLGEIHLRRLDWDKAIEPLQRLQRDCPMNPLSWRGLAGIYLDRGEDEAALAQLLELARLEPNDPEFAARIADLSRKKGDLREARYWLGQALAADPLRPALHGLMAEICLQLDDTGAALREYKMLTLLEPGSAKHFADAAMTAQKLGDKAAARGFAHRAVALDPQSPVRSLLDD